MTFRFGTAGLRAPMGPGPDRFNVETVARCIYGLLAGARGLDRDEALKTVGVVIGHDARTDSDRFAAVAAEVVTAAGFSVVRFDGPVPTPMVSFAVRSLEAPLGVMVTASHNPPIYNGLKIFGAEGAQIVPPFDAAVEREIDAAPDPERIPRQAPTSRPIDLDAAYLQALDSTRRDLEPLGIRAAYSALHGVGARLFGRLAERHGLELSPVPEQQDPDGRFPTVASPNPEDPEALGRALARGRGDACDLVLVHDPDADRLAAAVAHDGEQVVLTGDQIGVLLADHGLVGRAGEVVASTVVSSRMAPALARARGAESLRTPTGFKWMARAAARLGPSRRVVLAYEQALGFSVADVVRDKDGLGAALALAEAARDQKRRGRTLLDRWAELEAELGVFHTDAITLTWAPGEEGRAQEAFERFRTQPPAGDEAGTRVAPVVEGPAPADLVLEELPDGSWLAVRPSGTEPKLKVYIEAREPPGPNASARAEAKARRMREAVRARLGEGA